MAISKEDLSKTTLEQRHIIFRYLLNSHDGIKILSDKKTTIDTILKLQPVARPVQHASAAAVDNHQREYNDCYTLMERMDYVRQNNLHKAHYVKDDLNFYEACQFICNWYLNFILVSKNRKVDQIRLYKALDRKDCWNPTGLTQYQALWAKEFRDIIVSPQLIGIPAEGRRQFLLNGFRDTALRSIRRGLVDLLLDALRQIKNMASDAHWKTAGVRYIFFQRKTPAGVAELRDMPIPQVNIKSNFEVENLFAIYHQAQSKVWAKVRQHSIFRTKETQQFYETCCDKLDVSYPAKR